MSNRMRLYAMNRGGGVFGEGIQQQQPILVQPRSITSGWVLNFEQAFIHPSNKDYLRNEVLKQCGGAISEEQLLVAMDQAAAWYKYAYMEPTYGPTTPQEVQQAVQMMNQRTITSICRKYASQRAATSQWLQTMHQPFGSNLGQPEFDNDYDASIELFRN